jgi:hypothetical protein
MEDKANNMAPYLCQLTKIKSFVVTLEVRVGGSIKLKKPSEFVQYGVYMRNSLWKIVAIEASIAQFVLSEIGSTKVAAVVMVDKGLREEKANKAASLEK